MKSYPSISTKIDFSKRYYMFDKLDGSNIRDAKNDNDFKNRTPYMV